MPKFSLKTWFLPPALINLDSLEGGTGATFDHEVAKLVGEAGVPVVVAGGLNADTVFETVVNTEAFGVDVSSGVEASKGVKDVQLVKRFVRQAREGQAALKGKSYLREDA